MSTEPVLVPGPADAAPGTPLPEHRPDQNPPDQNPPEPAAPPAPAGRRGRGPRRRSRTVVLGVVVALPVALAACGVLVALDARAAQDALTAAAQRVPALQQAVASDADPAALAPALAALQRDTARARSHTDGPLWALAAHVPQVGPNLEAVSAMSAALDDVARDVAPALLDAQAAVDGASLAAGGTVDLAALRALEPRLTTAESTMEHTSANLDALDPAALLPDLADPLVTLRTRLAGIAPTVATARRAAVLLPPMLGADGPRDYLLLAMTNAELREGGGIPGALALVHADGGKVTLVREVPASAVPPFAAPVADLGDATTAVFSDRPARFVQDVTHTPDFPTTARLAAAMWTRTMGGTVDGVIATDPVALAHLLAVTGPVTVPTAGSEIQVTAANAVELLEHTAYLDQSPEAADAFFGEVLGATTTALATGRVPASGLVRAFAGAASEHRLLVWSRHDAEEARLADTVLSGAFLGSPRAADSLGIFLDDAVAGKMSWFLDSSVRLVSSQCTVRGRLDTVEVTLTSTAPADAATSLPSYVAGPPGGDFPPGTVAAVLRIAGPVGAPTPRFAHDGDLMGLDTHQLGGRSWAAGTFTLAPGQSTTFEVQALATPAASRGEGAAPGRTLDLWSTPTARAGGLQRVTVAVCP